MSSSICYVIHRLRMILMSISTSFCPIVCPIVCKRIENPEKMTKVKLCRMKEELESNIEKATFKRSKIIDQYLVGVQMKYALVKLNKPYYVGLAIL